ncbi:dGTPase [Oceanobacillus limi]|uniref:dGTPase n=1 Tax=Oceanobacillus limi TaxID=930131 RepID=A0A1H9Y0C3_9BACI|nr:dNTP triphosphohydrolase [Oceanobacillus limi]SES62158.1 dGTPase [Oceanobacillus limi]
MNNRMSWDNILNENRPRHKNDSEEEKRKREEKRKLDDRNEFERDYDRIVGSSSLRRLQDKAQVFPLQDNDFIRTRLTHSIEVSAIARSFGRWLEKWLLKADEGFTEDHIGKIPALLAVAGLVHDIGNPPFGHYGEDVIKDWFTRFVAEHGSEKQDAEEAFLQQYYIAKDELYDFLHFDGNAQGLRVLTRLQFLNDEYGINFTYGTLSVLLKYPWDSSHKIAKEDKKFGYFKQDVDTASDIINGTVGVKETRNPLTYLLEASDDIAYLGSDIEDGVKKGIVPWESIFEQFLAGEGEEIKPLIEKYSKEMNELKETYKDGIKELKEKHDKAKKNKFPDYELTSVQNFRVWAQGVMIKEVKNVFEENYDDIMEGNLGKQELLKKSSKASVLKGFFTTLLVNYIFPNKEVLSLELVGDSIIRELLDVFVKECILSDEDYESDHKCKSGKIFRILSDNFVFVHLLEKTEDGAYNRRKISSLSTYEKLLIITDFISGMTDSYALDLHKKITGVKMP